MAPVSAATRHEQGQSVAKLRDLLLVCGEFPCEKGDKCQGGRRNLWLGVGGGRSCT